MLVRESGSSKNTPVILLVSFAAIVVLSIGAFLLFDFINDKKAMEAAAIQSTESNEQLIRQATVDIADAVEGYETDIREISEKIDLQQLMEAGSKVAEGNVLQLFEEYVKFRPEVMYIYLGTAEKETYLYPKVELPEGYDPTSRSWYINAAESNTVVWSEPYVDIATGQAIITLSLPIYKEAALAGVLSADIYLDRMLEAIKDVELGKSGYMFVADGNGMVVIHPNQELVGQPIPVDGLRSRMADGAEGNITYIYKGVREQATYFWIDKLNLNLIGLMRQN